MLGDILLGAFLFVTIKSSIFEALKCHQQANKCLSAPEHNTNLNASVFACKAFQELFQPLLGKKKTIFKMFEKLLLNLFWICHVSKACEWFEMWNCIASYPWFNIFERAKNDFSWNIHLSYGLTDGNARILWKLLPIKILGSLKITWIIRFLVIKHHYDFKIITNAFTFIFIPTVVCRLRSFWEVIK